MSREITKYDDVIDSREITARIEELEDRKEEEELSPEEEEELEALLKLAEQCEGYGDWDGGEGLIRDSYFTDYIKELIEDCYSLPKEFNSGEWPWRHMKIDYEAAAEEAKQYYMEVDFDGVPYWMRA